MFGIPLSTVIVFFGPILIVAAWFSIYILFRRAEHRGWVRGFEEAKQLLHQQIRDKYRREQGQ